MDWDRTGEKLQKKLVQIFSSMDEIVDETLRNELIRTLNGRTKTVEGIRFILNELQELMDSKFVFWEFIVVSFTVFSTTWVNERSIPSEVNTPLVKSFKCRCLEP